MPYSLELCCNNLEPSKAGCQPTFALLRTAFYSKSQDKNSQLFTISAVLLFRGLLIKETVPVVRRTIFKQGKGLERAC